jgi:hypothetical protein
MKEFGSGPSFGSSSIYRDRKEKERERVVCSREERSVSQRNVKFDCTEKKAYRLTRLSVSGSEGPGAAFRFWF